jgi:hypothetical protein
VRHVDLFYIWGVWEEATFVTRAGAKEQRFPKANSPASPQRHHDWGDLATEDGAENEFSFTNGLRLLRAYNLEGGTRIWNITEADRLATAVLLPSEY